MRERHIRMRNRMSCVFLIVIIMTICLLPGCKTHQARPQTAQEVGQEANQEAAPQGIPLRPISQDIIDLVKGSGVNINNFQYYISSTIEIKLERTTRSVDVDRDGNVIVRNISMPSEIRINKETKGTYIISIPNQDNPTVIEICFDDDDKKNTLFFKANPDGTCFELMYTEEPQTIKYGGRMYDLSFPSPSEESSPIPPQLLIKFDERTADRPTTQVVPGSSINLK
jgi:hypothetical protein